MNTNTMNAGRRKLLTTSVGAIIAGFLGSRIPLAVADADSVKTAMAAFTENATPGTGRITLTAPEIAENGNAVPVSISVDSPMTDESYVESVMILAEGNPNPDVITFHFTPASGRASAATRMRLAKTQNVLAVAKMNDGSFFIDTRGVKVTIGGCGG